MPRSDLQQTTSGYVPTCSFHHCLSCKCLKDHQLVSVHAVRTNARSPNATQSAIPVASTVKRTCAVGITATGRRKQAARRPVRHTPVAYSTSMAMQSAPISFRKHPDQPRVSTMRATWTAAGGHISPSTPHTVHAIGVSGKSTPVVRLPSTFRASASNTSVPLRVANTVVWSGSNIAMITGVTMAVESVLGKTLGGRTVSFARTIRARWPDVSRQRFLTGCNVRTILVSGLKTE